MLTPKKRPKLTTGEMLAIPLTNSHFGCAQVMLNDDFGALIAIFDLVTDRQKSCAEIIQMSPRLKQVAYVNTASARQRWIHLCQIPVLSIVGQKPTLFFGRFSSGWTILFPDGRTNYVAGGEAKRADFITKGYVQKVLWLAEDIESLVRDSKPLLWPGSE